MRLVFISSVIATTVLRITSAVKASTLFILIPVLDVPIVQFVSFRVHFLAYGFLSRFPAVRFDLVFYCSLLTVHCHLITLSARARTFGGIVKPLCLAAFRLTMSSNFFGCSTGRSAGLAPLRILSTYVAARRNKSVKLTL